MSLPGQPAKPEPEPRRLDAALSHPAWRSFIRMCVDLGHGEIGSLKIQDGLPVLAEVVTKKVKFPA